MIIPRKSTNKISARSNFRAVLESAYDSYPNNPSRDFLGICLNLNDRDFINESIAMQSEGSFLLNEMALVVSNPKIVNERKGKGISVTINGKEYRYVSQDMPTEDLYRKFMGIYKHSSTRAFVWLKKNSLCYYGCRNPEGSDLVN